MPTFDFFSESANWQSLVGLVVDQSCHLVRHVGEEIVHAAGLHAREASGFCGGVMASKVALFTITGQVTNTPGDTKGLEDRRCMRAAC